MAVTLTPSELSNQLTTVAAQVLQNHLDYIAGLQSVYTNAVAGKQLFYQNSQIAHLQLITDLTKNAKDLITIVNPV